jgi:hypothetical protein
MYTCPYFNQFPQFYRTPDMMNRNFSYIRVLHASPGAPAVDVYANGNIIARNLPYKSFTPYIKVPSGAYTVRVFPTGKTTDPVIETSLEIPGKSIFTVAAVGRLPDIGLLPILEPLQSVNPGYAMVRFVHLSPTAPIVDITLPNGQRLFKDVEYKEITGYIPVRPGTYTLQARPTGTDKVALTVPNITLKANTLYSVYAVGLVEGNPPLQVLIPMDGGTYLKF